MYQISPRDFSKLNRAIGDEIEKVLLKFVSDGKIKVIPDEKPIKSTPTMGEKRKKEEDRARLNPMKKSYKKRRGLRETPQGQNGRN